MVRKFIIIVFVSMFFFAANAEGKMVSSESLNKLKENVENSESNYGQYKKNHEIASKNVEQAKGALKDLGKLKSQLTKNNQDVEKNKAKLDKMKIKLKSLQDKEQQRLQAEQKKLDELKKLVAEMEKSQKLRQENVLAYNAKMKEIDQEKKDWDKQRNLMAGLKAQIENKERDAVAEKEEMGSKRKKL